MQLLIFRTKGLNGADITSVDDIQVGDEVVVYASLVNYMGNTPETAQGGIIYSQKRNGQELEGGGETPDSPSTNPIGDGSLENPFNVSAVMALYANGNAEGQSVHVKGKISKVKSLDVSKWERAQYYISDDGTENGQFQIYNGYYLGGKPFTSNDQIKVGDEVKHKTFGTGTISFMDKAQKKLRVKFAAGEKVFVYPNAFIDGFLQAKE